MSLMDSVKSMLQPGDQQKKLYDLVYDLWENKSCNMTEKCKVNFGYWEGDYKSENDKLNDQKKTACNIVKRIVEVKGSSALDAQFTMNVVPVMNAFADWNQLQEMHDYADILNDEVHNVLKENDFDGIKEKSMRRGLIAGYGPSQTTWETQGRVEGYIKLSDIEPSNLRWDANAKKMDDCTFLAYTIELNPIIVKNRYAKNPDGSWNDDLIKKIDQIAESKSDMMKGERKGVVNVSTAQTASQAFAYDSSGIKSGKTVKMVAMFILDDSVYAPQDGDDADTEAMKQAGQMRYPNGRIIIFSTDTSKKIIFNDRPAPAGFKSLGNIDIFKPVDTGEMTGKDEVEDLIPIQDRINGAYTKIRWLIGSHISTFLFPNELKGIVKEGAFISNAITFLTSLNLLGPDKTPPHITNDNITEAIKLLEYIERLEREAYRTARINETTVSGEQQTGTTSADQVEALQASPMASIRAIQRNFKNYCVSVGEKIVTLVQENYSVQRMVKLSTGKDNAEYARFNTVNGQRTVELMDKAGKAIREIKVSSDWKFRVDVVAGTEIPRSRTETSNLTAQLAKNGAFGDIHDPDSLELLLRSLDYPNYRAIVQMAKKKQKEAAKRPFDVKALIMNPEQTKAAAAFLEALQKAGRPEAIEQCLKMLGLPGAPGTLATTPVQDVSSKADVKDIVAMTPGMVAPTSPIDQQGREIAAAIIDNDQNNNNAMTLVP